MFFIFKTSTKRLIIADYAGSVKKSAAYAMCFL